MRTTTDTQLVEAGKRLEELNAAGDNQVKGGSTENRADVLKQIEEELKALSAEHYSIRLTKNVL
jgi:hypothetical protein